MSATIVTDPVFSVDEEVSDEKQSIPKRPKSNLDFKDITQDPEFWLKAVLS